MVIHTRIQKVLSEGVQLCQCFFFFEGKRIQVSLKVGQHGPASQMALKWQFAGGPMVAQNARLKDMLFFRGSGSVLQRNPIFLSFPRGSGPSVPPLDPHMSSGPVP